MFNFLFNKLNEKDMRSFINQWNIDQCDSLAISVNTSEFSNSLGNMQIESSFQGDRNRRMVQWAEGLPGQEKAFSEIALIENQKMIKKGKINKLNKESSDLQNIMAGILHLHMIRSREHLIEWAKTLATDSEKKEAMNSTLIQGEDKALEWMRVSLLVLNKALEDAIKDTNSTIQMMLFSGHTSARNAGHFCFKLRIYNLDIEIKESSDPQQPPVLTVWDKKNEEEFKASHQVLKTPLKVLINPILDEIIKVLPLVEILTKKRVIHSE